MALLELPIFPLPLVLFPGASQLLHIFEPRYRQMLADCLEGDERFGISWVDGKGREDVPPEVGTIGCIARVQASTPLPDGRSNILTVGEDRYTILAYLQTEKPYRMARVETFGDDPTDSDTPELGQRVSRLHGRLRAALSALNDLASNPVEAASDPTALSFQVAAELELESAFKQELLVMRSTRRRLEALEQVLRRITADLGPRAEVHVRARKNGKGGSNATIVQGS